MRAKIQYGEVYRLFSALLVREREARGLSQTEVARRLQRQPSTVWKYENGELRLDVVEFIAFSRAIGFNPIELLQELADHFPEPAPIAGEPADEAGGL